MRLKHLKEILVKEFLHMICWVLLLFWPIGFNYSFAVLFLVLGVELMTCAYQANALPPSCVPDLNMINIPGEKVSFHHTTTF